jgi:uncharacterized membrane protein YgcG
MMRHSLTVLRIVAIAAVMVGLACHRPQGRPVVTDTEVALDQKALEQLRSEGSDLSKTHTIQFYLYVPSQQDANAAATRLQGDDFDTVVKQDGQRWLCLGQKSMVPTIENLSWARQVFKIQANDHHGKYDGWKASVEP